VRADELRRRGGSGRPGLAARAPLERREAEVRAGRRAGGDEVDLLGVPAADVADQQRARAPVEREAPRVAQAERVDLGSRLGGARVDPQDLAAQAVGRLRLLGLVADTGADVQQAVGAELELAAVVLARHGAEVEDTPRRAGAAPQLVHPHAALAVDVGDVEAAALAVVGRERDREQAALIDGLARVLDEDPAAQVGQRLLAQPAAAHDPDAAAPLDDGERARRLRRGGDVDGLVERADALQPRVLGRRGRRRRHHHERHQEHGRPRHGTTTHLRAGPSLPPASADSRSPRPTGPAASARQSTVPSASSASARSTSAREWWNAPRRSSSS
jgi:hypothetical protein